MRWRLRQLIPQLVSFREVGHFVATSMLLILITMVFCGALFTHDNEMNAAGLNALLFAVSTLILCSLCDVAVWAIKRGTR